MSYPSVRPPVVAGLFYPKSVPEITNTLDHFFQSIEPAMHPDCPLLGAIVPHAGWRYSGQVASYSYSVVKSAHPRRVIILSPSHQIPFRGATIYPGQAYRTPLGDVPIDHDFVDTLRMPDTVRKSITGHEQEHAIEVQLPFLQYVLGEAVSIVPMVIGDQDMYTVESVAEMLASGWGEGQVVVASSDLSHYHNYRKAVAMDGRFQDLLEQGDFSLFLDALEQHEIEACGMGPVLILMTISRLMESSGFRILHYANSGDITGDRERVVGYLSAAVYSREQWTPQARTH